jgi:hypothetical protein
MSGFSDDVWRRAKRANRNRRHQERLARMTDAELVGWLTAVACDDLHDLQHHIQDAIIAQNARRIRELDTLADVNTSGIAKDGNTWQP